MTARDPLAGFAGITAPGSTSENDFYPGSKKKRRAVTGAPVDVWDTFPHVDLTIKGVLTRLYPVGVLADALERKPPAMRKWERLGYLPKARWSTPGRNQHGQKRLYTREQIEGLVEIARDEGLLGENIRNVSATGFPARAAILFKGLK